MAEEPTIQMPAQQGSFGSMTNEQIKEYSDNAVGIQARAMKGASNSSSDPLAGLASKAPQHNSNILTQSQKQQQQ